jgi:uncharacterized protein (DUF305 family)
MNKYAWGIAVLLILSGARSIPARQGSGEHTGHTNLAVAWPEFAQNMEKMHAGMGSVKRSGDNDVDFVKLMLPHHLAAIDMAKTELRYGQDPQMHRLAQEIITDQQSEIDLMQFWLKQHGPRSQEIK